MLNNWKLWIVVAFILALLNLNLLSDNLPLQSPPPFLMKDKFISFLDNPKEEHEQQKALDRHSKEQEEERPLMQHEQYRFTHSCPKEVASISGKRTADREEEERQAYYRNRKKSNHNDNYSLFNCFHPNAKCQYYYPVNFFDEHCGIGKSFLPVIQELHERKAKHTLWNNMPHLGIPLVTFQQLCTSSKKKEEKKYKKKGDLDLPKGTRQRRRLQLDKDSNTDATQPTTTKSNKVEKKPSRLKYERLTNIGLSYKNGTNSTKTATKCVTERFSFLHIHKNGGTSVRDTFADLVREHSQNGSIERNIFFKSSNNRIIFDRKAANNNDTPEDAASSTSSYDRQQDQASALELLQHATHYPTNGEYAPQQVVLVTLVRDPLSRFISSIGQALGGVGSSKNKIGKVLREACVDNTRTSQDALLCLARYVKEHGFWIELHFTPQALEISFATLFQDVPVAILEFPPSEILEYMGGSAEQKRRDGSKAGYRVDPILTNMSVSHYTAASLKLVCDIYEMDVILLRSLGIEVPKCDPYVS